MAPATGKSKKRVGVPRGGEDGRVAAVSKIRRPGLASSHTLGGERWRDGRDRNLIHGDGAARKRHGERVVRLQPCLKAALC